MKTAYLDCFSGASGDMLLGAMLHAGFPNDALQASLAALSLDGLVCQVEEDLVQGISCVRLRVDSSRRQELRTLPAILAIFAKSKLPSAIIDRASMVLQRLAEAEARVHRLPIEKVHFHEVGALDTIADVVGVVAALDYLQIDRLVCSPLPWARGFVDCAHGRLPLPAPAVCELLKEVPVYPVELEQELVTPTGAALVASLADQFGTLPPMDLLAVGYGAGSQQLTNGQPNLLRVVIGESREVTEAQQVIVVETNLDDWNSEGFPHLCQQLLEAGALDVSLTSRLMKKGRPGYCLQVICDSSRLLPVQNLIFSETSAIGLRYRYESRHTLPRAAVLVSTPWGEVQAKKVETPAGPVVYPEYEACREVARRERVPLKDVYSEVVTAGRKSR